MILEVRGRAIDNYTPYSMRQAHDFHRDRHLIGRRKEYAWNMPKSKPNPFCAIPGCKATAPHTDDHVVSGLMKVFSAPEALAYWSWAAMRDLRNSIICDIDAGRHFAWQTRLRQVEEIYFKALYCVFLANPNELPHIFSGATPNSVMPMYRKVNEAVLKGRGQWETERAGQTSGQFRPVNILHSSAHASYSAMLTAISYANMPQARTRLDGFIKHLNTYCVRLEYMHKMFKAGRDKQVVLDAFISMHRPSSYWRDTVAQRTDS